MTRRKTITILSLVVLATALVAIRLYPTTTYYRHRLEQKLSTQLDMRVTIERIQQKSKTRILHNVTAIARQRDVEIFRCERAEWRRLANRPQTLRSLKLVNGRILVGETQWQRDDYQQILQSSLGHDFAEMGITDIDLENIDLEWRHPQFTFSARHTTGHIDFDDDNTAHAILTAPSLNGSNVSDPIRITTQFTTEPTVRFQHVTLDIARLPLAALGIEPFVGGPVTTGSFRGTVVYRQADHMSVKINGNIENAQLDELTRTLPHGPYKGQVDLTVDLAEIRNRKLATLRLAANINDLHLKQITKTLNLPDIDGTIDLRVHNAVFHDNQLTHLSATGQADRVPLDAITALLGKGTITGSLGITVNAFQCVGVEIAAANIALTAIPPADAPGTIDRDVLRHLSELALGFDATTVIPAAIEKIEYTQLGVELDLIGDRLRVRGTHGPNGNRILTINLLGTKIPVVSAPDETYNIHDLLEQIRQKIAETNRQKIKQWWQERTRPDAD